MDKRSIIFVLALSVTLFLINTYFEQQNLDSLRDWRQKQRAKVDQKAQQLEAEIAAKTAALDELPVVDLFSDSQSSKPIAHGVQSGKTILTLAWDNSSPEMLYSKGVVYKLAFGSNQIDQLLVYHQHEKEEVSVATLPLFGTFNLQIVTLDPLQITLAKFVDGKLIFPQDELYQLKKELQEEHLKAPVSPANGIVFTQSGSTFLPAALYLSKSKSLLLLDQIEGLPIESQPALKNGENGQQELFYVLENNYQQLVFSNVGAALAEINLPFQTDENRQSIVKEIAFDRQMVENYPYNALFPLHPYLTADGKEHAQGKLGGYYPLIRRDLLQKGPLKSVKVPPRYFALNIVSDFPETAKAIYEVKKFDDKQIVFESTQPHRKVIKTYTLVNDPAAAPYCFDLEIEIEGEGRGLWLSSGVPEVEWISNAPAPALKYRMTRKSKSEVIKVDSPTETITVSSIYPDWACNSNGFFGMILDPLTEIDAGLRFLFVSGTEAPSRLLEIDPESNRFEAKNLPGYAALLPLKSYGGKMQFRIYAGPFAESTLNAVDKTFSDPKTGYNPDYIASQSFHGWFAFISEPFAKFLFALMKLFYYFTGSWAFSIILLTVALRLMLYPLNAWSSKSMLKMQQIAPKVTQIQEKYKDNKQKMQLEIMNLYRDSGVNPVSGCFPLIIQMPFLIGMFDLLKSTFELRGASFIPGWIDDLAAPDVLFSWNTPIYFIGTEFHLLPLLLGLVMLLQQRYMSGAPQDPNVMSDQQRQQRAMSNVTAVVFTFMFYNFPSGLNIYWLSSMLLGIAQQKWTQYIMSRKKSVPEVELLLPKEQKRKKHR